MVNSKKIAVIVSAFSILLLPPLLWSHPHVFIYNSVKVVFDEKGLAGFKLCWEFDEMFSSMIIGDFDKNDNKQLEPLEIEFLKKKAFNNLKNFNYFTHIKISGKPFKVQYVKDFSADIQQGKVLYRFSVPCHVNAINTFREVTLSVYDKSFYTSIFLVRNRVKFDNTSAFDLEHSISKNRNEAYYYGQIYPEEIILRFKKKND